MKRLLITLLLSFSSLFPLIANAGNKEVVVPLGEGLYVIPILDGAEFETVVSADGRVWMDRNLGASRVATSSTDSASYGDLFQWGRGSDGHQLRTSVTTSTLSSTDDPGHGNFIIVDNLVNDWRDPKNDNLWQGVTGINNPCPAGFRVPTSTEWGTEANSWSSYDAAGAFASPLRLVRAGWRYRLNGISQVDSTGRYWSSTVYLDQGTSNARYLYFFDPPDGVHQYFNYRAAGFSVRCIQD